eukprot:6211568-Amphidinium_carterae.1
MGFNAWPRKDALISATTSRSTGMSGRPDMMQKHHVYSAPNPDRGTLMYQLESSVESTTAISSAHRRCWQAWAQLQEPFKHPLPQEYDEENALHFFHILLLVKASRLQKPSFVERALARLLRRRRFSTLFRSIRAEAWVGNSQSFHRLRFPNRSAKGVWRLLTVHAHR